MEYSLDLIRKPSKRELISQNNYLLDQVEKYRDTIVRLKIEKSFLLDKLSRIDNIDEFQVSDGEESDDEPPLKKRRTNSKPRAKRNDSNAVICLAQRKDGTPCKRKATSGLQYCWHHSPSINVCEYRNSKNNLKKCNIPVAKETDGKNGIFCNYHKKKIHDQAAVDTENNLTNTEAQQYLKGIIPGVNTDNKSKLSTQEKLDIITDNTDNSITKNIENTSNTSNTEENHITIQ